MKAFLIDPEHREVRQIEYEGDHRAIYEHIGAESFDVATIGVAAGVKVTAYVDDGGYYVTPQHWFLFDGYPNPLPGKTLILGTDYQGASVAPPVDLSWVEGRVEWLGVSKPKLPDIEIHTTQGRRTIDMNAPDAPKSKEEAAQRINDLLGGPG